MLLLFSFSETAGQNLCTNGDFDSYTSLPDDYAQVCYATGWSSPSGICSLIAGTGSPDYYNTSGSGGTNPPGTWYATVMPHSGGGMEGFATVYPGSPNYREYIMRQLSSPLITGQTYSITMWITNGITFYHNLGANNLGVAFSAAPLVQNLGTPIAYAPQCEMSTILYSTTWTQVSFTYVATAPYQYVTIGNFRNDATTSTQIFGSPSIGCYYYIDDVVIQTSTPLPIELISFDGYQKETAIELKWTTASEINNAYFEIERSSDGKLFDVIGKVKGGGNSTQANTYSFVDEKPFTGINNYRLKQTDFNGIISYSTIVVVKNKNQVFSPVIFPNPAANTLNCNFCLKEDIEADIQVTDLSGRILIYQHQEIAKGNTLTINIESLRNGAYFLRISSLLFNAQYKFIKQIL